VRRVQESYAEVAGRAREKGIDIQAELRSRGCKDYDAFLKSCPQFDLLCWPSEFAELGSGFVLYFHFIAFLIVVLLSAAFVLAYPFVQYRSADMLGQWGSSLGEMVAEWYGTPGNLGPNGGASTGILVVYFAMTCAFGVAVAIARQGQIRVERDVDARTIQPNDFAIMVEGLPSTATDESSIMDFFRENAVPGRKDVEIVKVVIGWDAAEFREKQRSLKELAAQLKELEPSDPEAAELQRQVAAIRADLASGAPDAAARLTSSGVVVVVFRNQADQRHCLKRWASFWARVGYSDAGDCWGFLKGGPLPLFPVGEPPRPTFRLKVHRAPNPGDINWEDLGVPFKEKARMLLRAWGTMLLIIVASFWFCFLMVWIEKTSNTDSAALSILPSIGLMVANVIVNVASMKLGKAEYHNTRTGENAAQISKMALGMIVNTAFVLLLCWRKPEEWYSRPGLVGDISTLIGLTGVIRPIAQFILGCNDMRQCLKRRRRRLLTDEKFDAWNSIAGTAVAKQGKLSQSEQQHYMIAKREIDFWKTQYEQEDMQMTKRYAYSINLFVCSMLYCPLLPMAPLLGLTGLIVQYWLDKYLLLRISRRPSIPLSSSQARTSLMLVRLFVLIGLPLSMLVFLRPSWKEGREHDVTMWTLFSLIASAFFLLMPLSLKKKGQSDEEDAEHDYYSAQYLWPKELKYHKSHFLYKGLSEKKNPEFVKPGVKAVVGSSEIKSGYGSAVVGSDGDGEVKWEEDAADLEAPAAAVHAVTATAEPEPWGEEAPAAAVAPPSPSASASGARHTARRTGVVRWEFETDHGFEAFHRDCQDYIEHKYEGYTARGSKRVKVRTGGIIVSVDFERMTQMVEGTGKGRSGKIRSIRRVED
jgi:hypothetical protein